VDQYFAYIAVAHLGKRGSPTARFVVDELDQAIERLRQNQTELPAAMT